MKSLLEIFVTKYGLFLCLSLAPINWKGREQHIIEVVRTCAFTLYDSSAQHIWLQNKQEDINLEKRRKQKTILTQMSQQQEQRERDREMDTGVLRKNCCLLTLGYLSRKNHHLVHLDLDLANLEKGLKHLCHMRPA